MRRRVFPVLSVVSVIALGGWLPVSAEASAVRGGDDPLVHGFDAPPQAARPRVWWHWVNGNVSREGIAADTAWMSRVGIAGLTLFDAAFRSPPTPVVVAEPVIFHSPEWRDAVRDAAEQAARLDLDFGVHIAGGWSVSGGPWIQPQQAMKKLVWSEAVLDGGAPFDGVLPSPPVVSGVFQDYPLAADLAEPRLYRDVAVVAFPASPAPERPSTILEADGAAPDLRVLTDGSYAEATILTGPSLVFRYERPWTIRSMTIATGGPLTQGQVEVSEDGVTFRPLFDLPGPGQKALPVRTYAFAPTVAKAVRITLHQSAQGGVTLRELNFHSEARINRFEEKSGLGTLADYAAVATPATSQDQVLDPNAVIDLTSFMSADGRLRWTPPPGRWVVQRFGYTLTGKRNGPATPAATGLEADKLNADHVTAHLDGFFTPLLDAVGPAHGERGLRHAIVDSWEAGQQNWTEAMPEAFRARRGYDLSRFLPAMTGRVVADAETSDRFLWDFRATIGDLLAENHYAVIRDYVHARGLYLYGESMGVDLPTLGDGLRLKGLSDVPTGEFWAQVDGAPPLATHVADIREAASAAHIYGRTVVAAEAFTALDQVPAWSMGPADLKPIADRFMAEGVNRFIIHTSPHQPFLDRAPGVTLRRFGQHFSRHEAWGEQATGWLDYLARSGFLLQQGRAVADIAVFYGEGAPAAAPFEPDLIPDLPTGYDYDYVNAEVLLEQAEVRDGRIVLKSGANYRLLVLPPSITRMTPELAARIAALVQQGAAVLGAAPDGAPGLVAGSAAASDAALDRAMDGLWDRAAPTPDRRVGKGRVFLAMSAADALARLGQAPDVTWQGNEHIVWTHRRTATDDIYFVANPNGKAGRVELDFRIGDRAPELWRAIDGERRTPSWRRVEGRTRVTLDLGDSDAVFVVFRTPTPDSGFAPPIRQITALGRIDGPWTVAFQPGRGAPAQVEVRDLASWTDSLEPGVRYFSGAATYSTVFQAPSADEGRVILDLGEVREIAEVRLNGRAVGGRWTAPFRLDVTEALQPGENRLEVEVANYWHNRLIGDLQPGAEPVGFTTVSYYTPDTPLRPSGLLGPVTLLRVRDEAAAKAHSDSARTD